MALLDQWPEAMHATPSTVEVALREEVLVFDARTRIPQPGRASDPMSNLGLADGAHLEARAMSRSGRLTSFTYRFNWHGRTVDGVVSAARVGGTWFVADADGVLDVGSGARTALGSVRLLGAAGTELVVVRSDEVSRWSEGQKRCALPINGDDVRSVVANAEATVLATRDGALALDADCKPIGAASTPDTRFSFDGAVLWGWNGRSLHRLSLPDFRLADPPEERPGWVVGDRVFTLENDHLNVTYALGAVDRRYDGVGLESLTGVAAAGDIVAVTDGRVVAILGGPRWVEPGLVQAIRAVGPRGVIVEERGPGLYEHPRLVTLGEAPGPEPTVVGTPTSGLHTSLNWTIPAGEAVEPAAWFLGHPAARMACDPVKVDVDGTRRSWTWGRPTLVALALPQFLPTGADALSPALPPPTDDQHVVGRAEGLALHAACGRWLSDEAWLVHRGVATAWGSVQQAVRAMEAQTEGWMDTPREMPSGAWRVPAGGTISTVGHGVLIASANGSIVVGERGPEVRSPGWLRDAAGTWLAQVGPWSLRFDDEGTEMQDATVGVAVGVDGAGFIRRERGGYSRVERDGATTRVLWGAVLPSDNAVAGWRCTRDARTGAFGTCVEEKRTPTPDRLVGASTWTFDDGQLTIRRGGKVVFQREAIDEVHQAGNTLLVRAYATDRPWVRYDESGQALGVLAPGELAVEDGNAWIYDEDVVKWFEG